MKLQNLLLTLLIGFIIYTLLRKDKVETHYAFVGGKPDTVIIRDTVRIPEPYKVSVTKFDTIVVDSTGKIDYNAITASWERFHLKADTNIGCSGKVRLKGLFYEFDSVKIYYPKETIKINELNDKKFYEDHWFWTTVGLGIAVFL